MSAPRTRDQQRLYDASIEFYNALAAIPDWVVDDRVEDARLATARIMLSAHEYDTDDQRFTGITERYAADQAAYDRADDTVVIEMDDTLVITANIRTDDTVPIKMDDTVPIRPNVWTGKPNPVPVYGVSMVELAALIAECPSSKK